LAQDSGSTPPFGGGLWDRLLRSAGGCETLAGSAAKASTWCGCSASSSPADRAPGRCIAGWSPKSLTSDRGEPPGGPGSRAGPRPAPIPAPSPVAGARPKRCRPAGGPGVRRDHEAQQRPAATVLARTAGPACVLPPRRKGSGGESRCSRRNGWDGLGPSDRCLGSGLLPGEAHRTAPCPGLAEELLDLRLARRRGASSASWR